MTDLNNPAARLEYWLRLGERTGTDTDAWHKWAEIWDLNLETAAGRAGYHRRVADLMSLAGEIRARAEASPPRGPEYLDGFEDVDTLLDMFNHANSTKMVDFYGRMTSRGWYSISRLAQLFAADGGYAEVDDNSLQSLIDLTRKLKDDVVAATDLPTKERQDLLSHLNKIEDVLMRARIVGSEEVSVAVNGLLGLLLRFHQRGAVIAGHPVARGALALAGTIAAVMGYAADYSELANGGLDRILEIGPPNTD